MKKGNIIGFLLTIGIFVAIRVILDLSDKYQVLGGKESSGSTVAMVLLIATIAYLIIVSIKEAPKDIVSVKIYNTKAKAIRGVITIIGCVLFTYLAVEMLGVSLFISALLVVEAIVYTALSMIHQDGIYEDYFWTNETKIKFTKIKQYKITNNRITLYFNKKFLFIDFIQKVNVTCSQKESDEIAAIMRKYQEKY